jgi:tetratricopeptide (TPR) repeat protein
MVSSDLGPRLPGRERWLHLALLVVLPLLAFANTLQGEYHLDSIYRVAENPELEEVWPPWRHFVDPYTSATIPQLAAYRPMLPLTLSLDRAGGDALGLDARTAHHLGNVAIHVLTVLLVYSFFRELLSHWSGSGGGGGGGVARSRAALAGALVLAVHPISGVPVNYLCGRDLSLMLLFLTGTLLVYAHMRRLGGSWWRWPLVLALLLLALSSKLNAVALPGLVLAFELLCVRTRLRDEALWLRLFPLVGVVVGLFVYVELYLGFTERSQLVYDVGPLDYLATQLGLHLLYYGRNVVWPFAMRPLPDVELVTSFLHWKALVGGAFVAGTLVLAWRLRRRAPVAAFAIVAYWILFAPTSSVRPLMYLATDYRQYPSFAFLCLLLGLGALRFLGTGRRAVIPALVLLYFAGSAVATNRHWRTERSFWEQSLRHGGEPQAHFNYGQAVVGEDPVLAERHFREAIARFPNHVYAHVSLGLLQIRQGKRAEGLALVQRAAALEPADWGVAHNWLSEAYEMVGRLDDAQAAAWTATERDPRNPGYRRRAIEATYAHARQLQLEGSVAESLPFLERLHAASEDGEPHLDSLFLEGFALQLAGRRAEAIERYERQLLTTPDHPQVHYNLGFARMEAGRHADAVEHFQRTIELWPEKSESHLHLATCYGALGRTADAERHRALYEARTPSGGA